MLTAEYIQMVYAGDVFKESGEKSEMQKDKDRAALIIKDIRASKLNGEKPKTIAERHGVSCGTVYAHARKIREKS